MGIKKIINVLYIGNYQKSYPRNYNFIIGLEKHNVIIQEINFYYGNRQIIKYFLKNFNKIINLNFDLVIYHSLKASPLFIFARLLALIKRVPFINDYFISNLLSIFYDRKLMGKSSKIPKPLYWIYYYIRDFLECHLSNYIISDTTSHIKYFYQRFNIPLKKFRKVYIGARNDIFYPQNHKKKDHHNIIVGFWGAFIPLQGVEFIIKAIKLLENEKQLKFFLLGNGKTYKENRELANNLNLKNIEFIDVVPIEKVPQLIANSDIGLGIFGEGLKTQIVIPNKVFDGIAMKIPMITCNSPAINELFTNNENIILCESANPESIAKSILKLAMDNKLRIKIKESAYILSLNHCTTEKIGETLLKILNSIIN